MLTDEQRLAFCQELWRYWYKSGTIQLDQALSRYEREAKARAERPWFCLSGEGES